MDTRFLETFAAVARRGSFVGAAQELGISPNAAAQRLRVLEDEFGVPLVSRTGRSVRPTEAGHAVLARMPAFLAELRALRAAPAGQAIEGEIRVGAIATALTGLLPGALEFLAWQHPGLRIYLEPGTSSALYDRTAGGAIDAAVLIRPAFDWPKDMQFSLLRREPLVLLVPSGETRDDPAAILRTEPVVLYDRQQWGGRQAAAWLERQGLDLAVRFELDALDAIAVLVAKSLGVSVVPDWGGPWPEGVRLRRVSLPEPAPVREVGLLSRRSSERAHLVRVLAQAFEAA
jgi:DNA-binding transcriptional LysR family regulator